MATESLQQQSTTPGERPFTSNNRLVDVCNDRLGKAAAIAELLATVSDEACAANVVNPAAAAIFDLVREVERLINGPDHHAPSPTPQYTQ